MSLEFLGKTIATDDEGYLCHLSDYSEELREHLAKLKGISLNDDQRFIIATIRAYYEEFNAMPLRRILFKIFK